MAEDTILSIPNDKLQDVYRVLTGDYDVSHRTPSSALAPVAAVEEVKTAEQRPTEAFEKSTAAVEAVEAFEGRTTEVDWGSPQGSEDLDSAGKPWDEALHASSKAKNKDGTWRVKRGAKAEDAAPAPQVEEPEQEEDAAVTAALEALNSPAPAVTADEWSEAAVEEEEFEEAPSARQWTDADIGALASRVAGILGGPAQVKAKVVEYCPEGSVAHSRNIPGSVREKFAQDLEALARTKEGFENYSFGM